MLTVINISGSAARTFAYGKIEDLSFAPLHTLVPPETRGSKDLNDIEQGWEPRADFGNETNVYAILHGFDYYFESGSGDRLDQLGSEAFYARRMLAQWLHVDQFGKHIEPVSVVKSAVLGAADGYAKALRGLESELHHQRWQPSDPLCRALDEHLESFEQTLQQLTAPVPENVVQMMLKYHERYRADLRKWYIEMHTREVAKIINVQTRDHELKTSNPGQLLRRHASFDGPRTPSAQPIKEAKPRRGRSRL